MASDGRCPTGSVWNRRQERCLSVRGEMFGRAKRSVPGIDKWSAYGPGTSCPDYVRGRRINGFSFAADHGNYKINPVCDARGRARVHGYALVFENVKGVAKHSGLHQAIVDKTGQVSHVDFHRPSFRSAASAAVAARVHAGLVIRGLAGARRR
jgi:hypothetical protein